MSQKSFFTVVMLLVAQCCLYGQIVNIPDANFKNALVNTLCVDTDGDDVEDADADSNNDGQIQVSEAEAIFSLKVDGRSIQSLEGIEYFSQLGSLHCGYNQLTTLEVQGLSNLAFLNCSDNYLTTLEVEGLNNLESLNCSENNLNTLFLYELNNLKYFNCNYNQLNSLNIQGLSNLRTVACKENKLTTLDINGLSNLKYINCSYNFLTALDAEGLSGLTQIFCDNNQLLTITLQGLINLSEIDCSYNLLTNVDVNGFSNLNALICNNNQLTTLDVHTLTNLVDLRCNNNQLTDMDVQGLGNLKSFNCTYNQLTTLDLHELNNLEILWCGDNQLIDLNVQGLNNLKLLDCYNNQLTTLDLQDLYNLVDLKCSDNKLTEVIVEGLINVLSFNCAANQLSVLDLTELSSLRHLDCSINQFTTLDILGMTNLESLVCHYNQLTDLNVQELSNLKTLLCRVNQLTTLDLNGLSNLEYLDCYYNQLSTLDLQDQTKLYHLDCQSNQLTTLLLKNGSIEQNLNFLGNPLSYICCDPEQLTYIYNLILLFGYTNCVVNTACYNINTYLSGSVIRDQNLDCEKNNQEIGLEKRIIKAEKDGAETLFAISNNQGMYQMGLDTGLYKVSTYLFNNYSEPCEDSILVNLLQINDSAAVDLLLQPVILCPLLEVNIASDRMLRCFDNRYIVQYCNTGTASAPNAQVTIHLSDDVAYVSSTIPGTNVGGNTWQFSVGEVLPDDCGTFSVNFHVICDSTVLGQSICATAHITPDSICTPASTNWSGAQVMVNGYCEGDSVRFTIQNIGFGSMTSAQEYVVIEDDVILFQASFFLDPQEILTISVPANGSTWRLEAGQEPTFPFVSMPFASVEGCGLNLTGLFSLGFTTQFSEQDGNPFFSRDCREVIGSYDPNEKLANPTGVYEKHFIYPGTEIEYQVNFQNTGTDTAFTVVIRDTLSYGLDVTTFRAGISSHKYQVDVSGYGVLKFTFDNILLPDSNINEAASHGFVRFRITPKDTLQLGSRIENRAGIYFDFNPPIITNTVFHTVDTGFLERKSVSVHNLPTSQNGRVFPNPIRVGSYLFLEDIGSDKRVSLTDAFGRIVLETNCTEGNKILISNDIAGGIYFLKWTGVSGINRRGKLVVLE